MDEAGLVPLATVIALLPQHWWMHPFHYEGLVWIGILRIGAVQKASLSWLNASVAGGL